MRIAKESSEGKREDEKNPKTSSAYLSAITPTDCYLPVEVSVLSIQKARIADADHFCGESP